MGQTIGKVKTIYRAFFKESELDSDIRKKRLEICSSCPYNSRNENNDNLSLINKLRKQLIDKPFCTACGCQIYEKTGSITEACGLETQDEYPKWNRVKLERTNKMKLNYVNKSEDLVNPTIDSEGTIVLDMGEVERASLKDVEFEIHLPSTVKLNIVRIAAGCPACTKVRTTRESDSKFSGHIWVDWNRLRNNFTKDIAISYTANGTSDVQRIRLKGKILN